MYAAAISAARLAAQLAPAGDGKVVRSLRARRNIVARLRERAHVIRDPQRPLLWMHAPSVGEGLQARPVLHAWRAAHPDWQIAYTFFSPSAEHFAQTVGADIVEYLPFDSASDADAAIDAIDPTALCFAKLDVWPVLVERAHRRAVALGMISATLAASSSRRGWWSRQLLHDAYATLGAVGVVDDSHRTRLLALGVAPSALCVTGDTRFDQVAARAATIDRTSPMLIALASSRVTAVAGSTWPADHAVIFPAWKQLLADATSHSRPRLIVAPHEPNASHLAEVESWAASAMLSLRRLSAMEADASSHTTVDVDIILVDRVGVLGDLYALANVAYVGGGFHRAGLHSMIEPAAFGIPVVCGPSYAMSREAALLIAAGGARAVIDCDALFVQLSRLMCDTDARAREGARARSVVDAELGATARSVAMLERLVGATSSGPRVESSW